jgi:hypothetical protein
MGLESLLPAYREQYNALMPEIERGVNADLIRRGMFNSGAATDSMARAKADLLAELAAKSAGAQTTTDEANKDRALQERLAGESRKEARRAQLMNLLGSGATSAATLYALGAFKPQGAMAQGAASHIPLPSPSFANPSFVPDAADAITSASAPSMWQNMKTAGLGGAAAGLTGGMLGRNLAGSLGGKSGLGTDIGSGLGGLAGLMLASKFGVPGAGQFGAAGSPWAAGLGALLGSGAGGLLGGLFK